MKRAAYLAVFGGQIGPRVSGDLHFYRDCLGVGLARTGGAAVIEIEPEAGKLAHVGIVACPRCVTRLSADRVPAVECAWCHDEQRPGVLPASHGICGDCFAKFIDGEVNTAADALASAKGE